MSITARECIPLVLSQVPGFRPFWEKHIEWWDKEDPGLGNDISAFSRYVVEVIKSKQTKDIETAFALLELLLIDGTEEVRTAIATNCLENIINRTSSGQIDPKVFVEYLGKESRAFCLAWDRFTGVNTPGLEKKDER